MVVASQSKSAKTKKSRRSFAPHKPHGVLSPRVQSVGPERFGIVPVDCHKHRSKLMCCDFYGNLLVPPWEINHSNGGLGLAIERVREAHEKHGIQDCILAIERTGSYHLPVKRAFSAAGFECRIVHPFATKTYRQAADPGDKTDENDLSAVFRAAVNGFGLVELSLDSVSQQLRILVRHRRDLVRKRSSVCCQIREHLEAFLPGYAAQFHDLWDVAVALPVARRFSSAEAIRTAGVEGLLEALRATDIRGHRGCLQRIVSWTGQSPQPDSEAALHQRILIALDDDRLAKTSQILAVEREIAGLLVQTPYVLLISLPGINVVSAAEYGGEMGPITHYANAKAITGRAGLFPSRHQSDRVDHAHGSLIRCANRELRAALLMVAGNLLQWNHHFKALNETWQKLEPSAEGARIKIASRFARISFHMVSGGHVFNHPAIRERDYILEKLIRFHQEHDTPADRMMADLQLAIDQIPPTEWPVEAVPLERLLETTRAARTRGPQRLGDLLPVVLAKLGAGALQSQVSGECDPG